MTARNGWLLGLTLAVTLGFAWYAARHPMDFRVYHYGARGVFDGTRPVYGKSSGLGWPMHYRYPPLFLLLFAPFAVPSLGTAAALWLVAKAAALFFLVQMMVRRLRGADLHRAAVIVPILLAGPYVVEDLRYGNAQMFVFILTAVSLMIARQRPVWSALSLAAGICIKVWPLFFLPYLFVRGDRRVVSWTLVIALCLTLVPSLYFGALGNAHLLREWFNQEFATQTGQDEIWFPSQSLRGVMMRYLTVIDYSQVPDSNYPAVQLVSWNPASVRLAWAVAAAAIYFAFLGLAYSTRESDGWMECALGFCLVAMLEPFTQKYALVILLWPAVIAARLTARRAVRNLIGISIALVLIQPLIPGSLNQRWMQALGFDFLATAILAAALLVSMLSAPFFVTLYSPLRNNFLNSK